MSFDNAAAERMCAKYKELIRKFIDCQISGREFESAYLALFKHDNDQVPGTEFNTLEGLFFAVDDYVADPELRKAVHGLDDEELRDRAREAYRKLYET
jgi:Bacterial self-protective colicin-like immunity